jgi:hypothetical protein
MTVILPVVQQQELTQHIPEIAVGTLLVLHVLVHQKRGQIKFALVSLEVAVSVEPVTIIVPGPTKIAPLLMVAKQIQPRMRTTVASVIMFVLQAALISMEETFPIPEVTAETIIMNV